MPKLLTLSERDVKALRGLLDRVQGSRRNPEGRPDTTVDDHQAPEVYVAKTPSGGIPALDVESSTSYPGVAQCNIYKLSPSSDSSETAVLLQVEGLRKWVRNLTESDIAGSSWVLVVREKFGSWIAVTGGAGEPLRFVKVQEEEGVDGYYDAVLMEEQDDGSLEITDPEEDVWFYEANKLEKVEMDKIFGPCKKTGEIDGVPVYAFSERKIWVERETGSSRIGPHIHTFRFSPREYWEITEPDPGVAEIKPDLFSGTINYCGDDGVIHVATFDRGWLVTVV